MKPLLLFLVVYNLNAIAHSHDHDKESALFKSFPKKVHQSQMLNPKLINSARYIKTAPPVEKSKKPNSDDAYTVFPKVSKIIPDSPYFPIDLDFFHKHREKKILPRSKRSAPSPNSPPAKVIKLVETAKPTAVKADSKPKTEKPKVNAKVNKPKAAVEPKKGTVNQANKPVPKPANPAKKGSKPVGRKRVSRKGVLPKSKKNSEPKKVSVPRKISRQGAKKTAHKVSSSKHPKGASRKRHRHLRSGNRSRKHTGKGPKPNLPVKGPGRRLIAARDGSAEDYPYMVSIQKDYEHWCSGAILNRRLIISTANCFWKSRSISHLMVRVGSRHPDQGGQTAYVQEVMKHPWWNIRSGPDCDIALALIDRMLKFSHSVHGVDLPNRAMMPPFDDFWVTSFGAERRDGVYERHGKRLQVFHARLMNHDQCNNVTQRFGVAVTENFICLTQYGRRAPCTRDTGAPAVSDGILWGLASWGIRKLCGTERYPSMYSYIASASNMDFILNATKHLMSDSRDNPLLDRLPKNYYARPTTAVTKGARRHRFLL